MRPEPGIRTEDLGDLINVALEEPVRQGFELPGFTTSQEAAHTGLDRQSVRVARPSP